MELFLIGFGVYGLTALALGIGVLFRDRPMHANCRGVPKGKGCASGRTCCGADNGSST